MAKRVTLWTHLKWHFLGSAAIQLALLNMSDVHAVPAALIAVNLMAFGFWALDKRNAIKDKPRVPERTLHVIACCGAAPASMLGLTLLHHKTSHATFRIGHTLLFLAWRGFLLAGPDWVRGGSA